MDSAGRVRFRWDRFKSLPAAGTFVPPTIITLERARDLREEVFGPILHVVRWRADALDTLLDDIAGNGYGLTLGIHSRIDTTVEHIVARLGNGNVYVNRNMIGAVVGTQPFGGTGLSGTGPKAGGPNYLQAIRHRAGGDRQHCGRRRKRLAAGGRGRVAPTGPASSDRRTERSLDITKILGGLGVIAPPPAPKFNVDPPMETDIQW